MNTINLMYKSYYICIVASGADFSTCIENIDIGGPSMLRSSAKNHNYVSIVTNPNQYERFI